MSNGSRVTQQVWEVFQARLTRLTADLESCNALLKHTLESYRTPHYALRGLCSFVSDPGRDDEDLIISVDAREVQDSLMIEMDISSGDGEVIAEVKNFALPLNVGNAHVTSYVENFEKSLDNLITENWLQVRWRLCFDVPKGVDKETG